MTPRAYPEVYILEGSKKLMVVTGAVAFGVPVMVGSTVLVLLELACVSNMNRRRCEDTTSLACSQVS